MRDKRWSRRWGRPAARTAGYEEGTADWVLANEAGWGLPHGGVVIIAGIVAAALFVLTLIMIVRAVTS